MAYTHTNYNNTRCAACTQQWDVKILFFLLDRRKGGVHLVPKVPGAICQVLGAICQVPGAICQVLGARCHLPGAMFQVPCSKKPFIHCCRQSSNFSLTSLFANLFLAHLLHSSHYDLLISLCMALTLLLHLFLLLLPVPFFAVNLLPKRQSVVDL